MYKVGMIGLGCPKNQVDAEMMLSLLHEDGFDIVGDIEQADVVIVNTCGFIDSAKAEAIEEILNVASYKQEGLIKAIVVTGCLAQRYKNEIMEEIPEVDAVIGIGANGDIVRVCREVLEGKTVCEFPSRFCLPMEGDRILTTPSYYAYLKIAEGCSNCCTYCAIPSIRGKFRSREFDNIVAEAKNLADSGVKELIIVAQDVTKYGIDLYGEYRLAKLLRELCKIDGIEWIRLLYCYPESITDELIDTIKTEDKICKYIDIPLQHSEDRILKLMNRKSTKDEIIALMKKLRREIPDIVIRTTFIVGFPTETEEEFEALCEFVDEIQFDRCGFFPYSPEEGTLAAKMEGQIDGDVKSKRCEIIYRQTERVFDIKEERMIDRELTAIVDGYDEEEMLYFGRSYMDCPEIDLSMILSTEDEIVPGQFVKVRVTGAYYRSLICEVIE